MYMINKYGGSSLADSINIREKDYMILKAIEAYSGFTTFEYYDEFLKLCSKFLKEISIQDNPISILENISCLLSDGFFSHGDNFEYNMNTKSTFITMQGINVVLGSGVCRHASSFTTGLLLRSGVYCEDFYCYSTSVKTCESLSGNANHAANLIRYNGNWYIYDVLTNKLLRFTSPIEAEDYEGKTFFYYKPKTELEYGLIGLMDLEEKLIEFESSIGCTISKKEYDEIVKETAYLYAKNIGLLFDYARESDKLKHKIYRQTSR